MHSLRKTKMPSVVAWTRSSICLAVEVYLADYSTAEVRQLQIFYLLAAPVYDGLHKCGLTLTGGANNSPLWWVGIRQIRWGCNQQVTLCQQLLIYTWMGDCLQHGTLSQTGTWCELSETVTHRAARWSRCFCHFWSGKFKAEKARKILDRDSNTPTRSLRSANSNLLSIPRVRTAFASSAVSVAAPAVRNSFGIRDSSSTHIFRHFLKTHCFQQAFGSP